MTARGRVRGVVALSGLAYVGVGGAFLLYPGFMAGFVDLSLPTATAKSDIRALFGGLEVGVGVALLIFASVPGWLGPGLVAQIASFAGLVTARLLSLSLDGVPGVIGLALLSAEVAALFLGLTVAWQWAREPVPVAGQSAGDSDESIEDAAADEEMRSR